MNGVLKDEEKVLGVLEGLVDLYDLRMIESCKDSVLVDNAARVFDKFLFYPFDCPHSIWVKLHFCLINSGKSATAYDLHLI